MPDIEIRRDRVRVFVIVLCKKSHVLRAEEISGINKAGKYMLSVERAAFVPIDVLSDLDYFAVRNSHVALEHFPIADMKRCIFQNHSFFPPLSSQKQLSFLRLYYCYY